jgi:hypothetical protein
MNLSEMKIQEGFVTVISLQRHAVNISETQISQLATSRPLSVQYISTTALIPQLFLPQHYGLFESHRREHFIINNREIIISHEDAARGVVSIVRVRKVRVAVHIGVAVTCYQKIGSCPKYWSTAVKNVNITKCPLSCAEI